MAYIEIVRGLRPTPDRWATIGDYEVCPIPDQIGNSGVTYKRQLIPLQSKTGTSFLSRHCMCNSLLAL